MKGQTLIEALIAFGLIAVVISGISVLATNSLSNARHSKDQNLASQYVQEGIEMLRKLRNSNYEGFAAYNGPYCLGDNGRLESSLNCADTVNVNRDFIRSVKVEPGVCSGNASRVTVTLKWTDGKCNLGVYCHNSQATSCISVNNPIPTP